MRPHLQQLRGLLQLLVQLDRATPLVQLHLVMPLQRLQQLLPRLPVLRRAALLVLAIDAI